MRLLQRRRLEAALLVAFLALIARPPVALAGSPPFTPSGQAFSISAASLSTTGVTYAGNVTLAGLPAMDLRFTGLSVDGFQQLVACHAAGDMRVVQVSTATSAAFGGTFEVWATQLAYTDPTGPSLDFTPAAPPAIPLFLTGDAL